MSPKELVKLAAACRKAGIKHYKTADFEFTLTDEIPLSPYKAKKQAVVSASSEDDFESDALTDDQLLNWSVVEDTK